MKVYTKIDDEYILRLFTCFKNQSFKTDFEFPEIYLSPERKISKKELWEAFDKKQIEIDQYLGQYFSEQRIIIIYYLSIGDFAEIAEMEFENVFKIVLLHEFAHAITHLMPDHENKIWESEYYIDANISIHECYAQLLAYWALKGSGIECDLERMTKYQPEVYSVYLKFNDCFPELMIKSLEKLRKFNHANWNLLEQFWVSIIEAEGGGDYYLTRGMYKTKDLILEETWEKYKMILLGGHFINAYNRELDDCFKEK